MGVEESVVATVKDYWEGWFDGDAERMERALHPSLVKTGATTDGSGIRVTAPMSAGDMIGWTRAGEGVAEKPADPTFEVVVHDTYGEIATVTVRSGIYREYLHLVRTPDGWRILNALYMRVTRAG